MIRRLGLFLLLLAVAACGGGGGSSSGSGAGSSSTSSSSSTASSSSSSSSSSSNLTNLVPIAVDIGPAGLSYESTNVPYVSVTVCVPGTSTCQVIDHIVVDTGSIGLRIEAEALSATMMSNLPHQKNSAGQEVGECYAYVDGYVFGSVRTADFAIGGESVANMPFQVIADPASNFAAVPSSCSSGGGSAHDSIEAFGAKGIIGIGSRLTDCGSLCASGLSAAAIYYACPSSGCVQIAQGTTASAPNQQLPNPVAQFAVNNNGTLIRFDTPNATGQTSLTGTLIFGIGTQSNNALLANNVMTTTLSGLLTATYNGTTLSRSFIDSGTNFLSFTDSAIAQCTGGFAGFYCPTTPIALTPSLKGQNNVSSAANVTLNNARSVSFVSFAVAPGLGGDPNAFSGLSAPANSFDFGLPFYFGRTVYTGIETRNAGAFTGPFVAYY